MKAFYLIGCLCVCISLVHGQTDTTQKKDTASPRRPYSVKDTTEMGAVTVYARKPLIRNKVDGFVYDVENSVVPPVGSAADVLRKIPGLFVDQNGNLSVAGKQSLRVFIDNRPSDIYAGSVSDALLQVAAGDIASVEVITHPSAKYDAEGADAVVNIITKKNKFNGANGNVRAAGNDWGQNINSSLRIRRRSVSVNADLGGHHYYRETQEELERTGIGSSAGTNISQQSDYVRKWNQLYAGIQVVVSPDSLKTLNGGYRYRIGMDDISEDIRNTVTKQGNPVPDYSRLVETDVTVRMHSFNWGYTAKSANKKSELAVLGNWFYYNLSNDYLLNQQRLEQNDYRETSSGRSVTHELALQTDYSYQFSKRFTLEAGVKGMWRYLGNNNLVDVYDFTGNKFVPNSGRSNSFNYRRGIYAGYANYNLTLGAWSIRLGGRYEQTKLETKFKNTGLQVPDYRNFIPTILVSRSFKNGHTVKASYRKSILRPYLSYLDPNINYADSLNIQYGNPYLVPVVTHGYQLAYNYGKGKVNTGLTLYYNRNTNNIEYIRLLQPGGINETTYRNIGRMQETGVTATLSLNGYQKFSANLTFNPRYYYYESKALDASNGGWVVGGTANASYRITKTWGLETVVYLNGKAIGLQGTETRYQWYTLTVSKKLLNENLVISLTGDNPLMNRQTITGRLHTNSFDQVEKTHYRSQYITLVVNYKFGKKDVKVTEARRLGED